MILDEFPQLGNLPFFESALSYTAGYGLQTLLIAQDLSQVYKNYGQHECITSSCEVMTIYAPQKLETAQHFSNMLGAQTVTQEQTNYSGHRTSAVLSHINTSEHNFRRSLLTPDELMRLPFDQSIVFKAGHNAIQGKKIMYWQDPIFNERAKIPCPTVSDKTVISHEWQYVEKYAAQSLTEKNDEISQEENEDNDDLL